MLTVLPTWYVPDVGVVRANIWPAPVIVIAVVRCEKVNLPAPFHK